MTKLRISALVLVALVSGCEATLDAGPDAPTAVDAFNTRDAVALDATAAAPSFDAPPLDAFALPDAHADAFTPPPACPCFDGPGTYCEADVAARAGTEGCVVSARATGTRLVTCSGTSTWRATATCASGCEVGETGPSAECSLPICDCFVRAAWCGASAARHGLTLSPPCRVPLVPLHDTDILGCDGTRWIVQTECAEGCFEAPTGTADACITRRATPAAPGWPACADRPLLHAGLHPEASDRLRCAGVSSSEISQTIGSAPASAGYHALDGRVAGVPYTAAVDLRTRGMTDAQIRTRLARLGENGFAAWYRQPGRDGWPSSEAPHIHAVFAGVIMKAELRAQVRDYLSGRNGLASHTRYGFWSPPASTLTIIRLLFQRNYTP
jgi:hypothetical protein